MTRVKICGVTSVADALDCVRLGADSIGLNFVAASPRLIDHPTARSIVEAVRGRTHVVGVVADMPIPEMRELKNRIGIDCIQLHGSESPEVVRSMLPHAFKALRVGGRQDLAPIDQMPGRDILVDSKANGVLGGTGTVFDWTYVTEIARRRRLTLAGGLTPDNVGAAVLAVRPWCVDTASGVESDCRHKDLVKVKAFIEAVRAADRLVDSPAT
jgi:phosphoribosylanthranilate isomerase